jgi:hypothetical protein
MELRCARLWRGRDALVWCLRDERACSASSCELPSVVAALEMAGESVDAALGQGGEPVRTRVAKHDPFCVWCTRTPHNQATAVYDERCRDGRVEVYFESNGVPLVDPIKHLAAWCCGLDLGFAGDAPGYQRRSHRLSPREVLTETSFGAYTGRLGTQSCGSTNAWARRGRAR